MDTWIVLKDIEGQGERNRGLTIVKSRGMAHSNQFRRFKLSDKGLMLEDAEPVTLKCRKDRSAQADERDRPMKNNKTERTRRRVRISGS